MNVSMSAGRTEAAMSNSEVHIIVPTNGIRLWILNRGWLTLYAI
jgi:hypothetical protein